MTRIIEFLIALGIVVGLAILIGLVLPDERHLSESVETNRKMTIVYDTVNSFHRFKDWNPIALRDPKVKLKLSGPDAGKGARLDYSSTERSIGDGSWTITSSEPDKSVVIAVDSPSNGHDKTVTFTLEPTGKNNRNVKITQEYDVKYGWNLLGRYAGLYVGSQVGDDLKLGIARLANILATVPNFDYRAEYDGKPVLADLHVADVPAESLLVVNAGNIDRDNDTIERSIKNNQEWIKRVMDANDLEPAGPVRIITTDFGAEKYAFDVAQPVKKKGAADGSADLKLAIPSGAPVQYVHAEPHRAAMASYVGHMAGLDTARNALRAWATTAGYDVTDRPYESWKGGVDKGFTQDGSYDIYWAIK
ncbi:SRPBCC family protein [Xanthomonas massiliensis]|jgi:hypothetical protein|uniref:SRPBCC family protein n=1 Tax=Xanthomonas massiliensis TaxID=1720302 RepID=UPI0008259CE8|nr:SRPBCC family protein [Xanthomonas massiliensis]